MNTARGFTLIEILVVISIIAILAVIGISVYSGAQGAARDGRRRSEVTSIARSIESAKDYTTGVYKYDSTTAGNDFPKGLPDDPNAAASTPVHYCITTSNSSTTPPAVPNNTWTNGGCPASPYGTVSSSTSTTSANNLGATTPDVKSWTLCAQLERSTTPFCVSSLTK